MGVLDFINERWSRETMRFASVPTDPYWGRTRAEAEAVYDLMGSLENDQSV
jgi:hypothetical protein